MIKNKFFLFSFLIILLMPGIFYEKLSGILFLNDVAIKTSKNLLTNGATAHFGVDDISAKNSNLVCHFQWLSFDPVVKKTPFDKNQKIVGELLDCSLLHVYFIRIFAPTDMELAQKAAVIYPEDPGILYWLADGIEKDDPDQAEQLFRRIVDLQPENGRAWHRLGRLVEQRGLIDEAIGYYHNSCVNMDPGNHGCLNTARLLEQEGRYEEAIYYYRLSRLDYIRANADRLEEMLAGSD